MRYDRLTIGEVKTKHIIQLLDKCGEIKKQLAAKAESKKRLDEVWTNNNYNSYRRSLDMLFKVLIPVSAIESNIIWSVPKKKTVKKIRETLTLEQRKEIDKHLLQYDYTFRRFMQIFFHAGCRETELLQVKLSDVDLANQRFKVLVKKGNSYREEWRTIKTIILFLWQEACGLATGKQVLFAKGLVPGEKAIRREQITRRRHVKNKLGITADFYSLKHSNLDAITELQGIKAAQEMAGHSTPVVTMVYTTGEPERKHKRLKDADNKFA